jgi:hypothetical protein
MKLNTSTKVSWESTFLWSWVRNEKQLVVEERKSGQMGGGGNERTSKERKNSFTKTTKNRERVKFRWYARNALCAAPSNLADYKPPTHQAATQTLTREILAKRSTGPDFRDRRGAALWRQYRRNFRVWWGFAETSADDPNTLWVGRWGDAASTVWFVWGRARGLRMGWC